MRALRYMMTSERRIGAWFLLSLAAILAVLWASTQSWPGWVPWGLGAAMTGSVLSLIGSIVVGVVEEEDHRDKRVDPANPGYCSRCGQQFVVFTNQDGFDRVTGQPNINQIWACPDWDSSFARFNEGRMECRVQRVTTMPTRNIHQHEPFAQQSNCPACVEALVASGKLTREQADLLLSISR